jgi:hypothetical protein
MNITWTENIIVADADYVDQVAFDLTVNFERMLGRRVPQADMSRWAECVALDGGLREGEHLTTVILIHDSQRDAMRNFTPGRFRDELEGQAFSGPLGEFTFATVQTEAMATKEQLAADIMELLAEQQEVKRIMVALPAATLTQMQQPLQRLDDDRRLTIFTMQQPQHSRLRHELLGYSIMAALGISANEIDEKLNKTE